MDRSYGRGAARRIFWQGILDRSYEGFIRFFVATLCCRRQLNAFWQMLAWLALALPPLALLGSQQPAAEAGNASAVVGGALLGGLPPNGLPPSQPQGGPGGFGDSDESSSGDPGGSGGGADGQVVDCSAVFDAWLGAVLPPEPIQRTVLLTVFVGADQSKPVRVVVPEAGSLADVAGATNGSPL